MPVILNRDLWLKPKPEFLEYFSVYFHNGVAYIVWGFVAKEGLPINVVHFLPMRSHGQKIRGRPRKTETFLGFGMLYNGMLVPSFHRDDVLIHQAKSNLQAMETKG